MALVSSPLLSMGASGQIGKSLVFGSWKGRKTVRSYTIPGNPKSAGQVETRTTFQWVHDAYKQLGIDAQKAWTLKAAQMKITGPNAFMSINLPLLKTSTDAHEIQFICEVNGGVAAAAPALTPGTAQIAATLTAPALPTGWSITKAVFCALKETDPHGEDETMGLLTMTKTSTPWTVTFTGLTTGSVYIVGGSFWFARSPTVDAFGVSSNATATPT